MAAKKSLNRRLLPIYFVLLTDILGFTILFPLMPFYAEHFGAGPVAVGSLGTIYAVCQMLAGPLLGLWSDRSGRKRVLLVSQIGSLGSFLMFAFAPSFAWLLLARAIDGLTAGNVSVAYACVADATEPEERGRAFTLMSTVFGVGLVIGPTVSGLLFSYGFRVPCLAAVGMSALSICLTFVLFEPSRQSGPVKGDLYPWSRLQALVKNPSMRREIMQFALFAFAFSLYYFGLPLVAERRLSIDGHAFGPREMGFVYLLIGAIGLGIQTLLSSHLLRRLGSELTVTLAWGLAVGGYGLLAVSRRLGPSGLAIVFLAVANALLRPTLTGLISKHVNAKEQGAAMGALQSFYSLADLLAPMLAGWLIAGEFLTSWGLLIAVLCFLGFGLSTNLGERKLWRVWS